MPYLGHVDDLVTLELHDIDVVGASTTSRRRNRAAGAGMGAMEHAVDGNVVPRRIGGERPYLVSRGSRAGQRGAATCSTRFCQMMAPVRSVMSSSPSRIRN